MAANDEPTITIGRIPANEVAEATAQLTERYSRLKGAETDRKLRIGLAIALGVLLLLTNGGVLALFFLQGLGRLNRPFSDAILGALITDTVAHVAGMTYIVTRYLFPGAPLQTQTERLKKTPSPKAIDNKQT